MRRHWPPEVAVRRLVGRRLPRKQDGVGRASGVTTIPDCFLLETTFTNKDYSFTYFNSSQHYLVRGSPTGNFVLRKI